MPPAADPTPAPTEEPKLDATLAAMFGEAPVTPKPPEPKDPTKGSGHSLASAIADTTPAPAAEPTEEEKKKLDEEKKKAAAPAEPAANANPTKVSRKARKPIEVPAAPTPAPRAPAPEPDAKAKAEIEGRAFEETLLEEEKDHLELARFAEKQDPSKYKGAGEKAVKFLKGHQAYIEEYEKKHGAGSFVEHDHSSSKEYQAWLNANRLNFSPLEVRNLERARMKEDLKREMTPEVEKVRDDTFREIETPKVRAKADRFWADTAPLAMPEDLAKAIKEKGPEAAMKEFPVEYRLANEVLKETSQDVEEWLAITTVNPSTGKTLKAYDPNNAQHQRIISFIDKVNDNHAQFGKKDQLIRGGKQFLPAKQYYKLTPDQQKGYWTFTREELIQVLSHASKHHVKTRIENEIKAREKDGFMRRPAAAPVADPAAPAPERKGSPPAPSPSPVPANSGPSKGTTTTDKAMSLMMGG